MYKIIRLFVLAMILVNFSCEKDFDKNTRGTGSLALQGPGEIRNIHFSAKVLKNRYSEFDYQLTEQDPEYPQTFPSKESYRMDVQVNPSGYRMLIDEREYDSPVPEWKESGEKVRKILNDGVSLKAWDASNQLLFEQDAENTGYTLDEVLGEFVGQHYGKSLSQIIEEARTKGAKVIETPLYYYVKTDRSSQNFEHNEMYVFSKSLGKAVMVFTYDDQVPDKLTESRVIRYNANGLMSSIDQKLIHYTTSGKRTDYIKTEFQDFSITY